MEDSRDPKDKDSNDPKGPVDPQETTAPSERRESQEAPDAHGLRDSHEAAEGQESIKSQVPINLHKSTSAEPTNAQAPISEQAPTSAQALTNLQAPTSTQAPTSAQAPVSAQAPTSAQAPYFAPQQTQAPVGFSQVGMPQEARRADGSIDAEAIARGYSGSISFKRWAARIIDSFVIIPLILSLFLLSLSSDEPDTTALTLFAIGFAALYVARPIYDWLCEAFFGTTIGKWALQIRVVNRNGDVPGLGKSFLRALIGALEFTFLFNGIVSGIIILATQKKQRLGDMAADTFVLNARDLMPLSRTKIVARRTIFIAICATTLIVFSLSFAGFVKIMMKPEVHETLDGKYEITVPSTWSSEDSTEWDMILMNAVEDQAVMVLASDRESSELMLEDFSITLRETLGNTFSAEQDEDRMESIQLNGRDAYRFRMNSELEGERQYYSVTVTAGEDKFYCIVAMASDEKRSTQSNRDFRERMEDKVDKLNDRIVETFQPVDHIEG